MKPALALVALACAIGLGHLPFVASQLEDIDSVNFALGVRDFDVAEHRPHPPGYPVYIAAGKTLAPLVARGIPGASPSEVEARTLSLVSLASAILAVFLVYRIFAATEHAKDAAPPPGTLLDHTALPATALTLACPLVWTLALRPMSDLPGLAAALAAQACLMTAWWWQTPPSSRDRRLAPEIVATSGRLIVLGALLAGLAVGVRTQTLWLTAPLLVVVLVDRIGRGAAGALLGATMTFTIGALAWVVPLVAASGGPAAYLNALGSQAGEDIVGGEMLYLNPVPRLILQALIHTFVDPWESVALASVVLMLAGLGALRLLWRDRRTLAAVIALALPYLSFHLLFQDTSFTRYAAPLVPAVAFLAVQGLNALSVRAALPGAAALSIWSIAVATPILREYVDSPAPAVQAAEMVREEIVGHRSGVLALHQTFVRPLEAQQLEVPQLPSPPRREWLELARFWREGHEGAVWFLADPRRTDLALIDPQSRRDVTAVRWPPSARRTFGGMRPAGADWIRLSPPRWFAEEGWSLTPETAGMARLMGRGPHLGPITAWVRRDPGPTRLLIGGRNLAGASDPSARVTIAIDDRTIDRWDVKPGFFLRTVDLAPGLLAGEGALGRLTVAAQPASGTIAIPTAIEQFDLQAPETLMWAFDEGWHEAEYSQSLGMWHWTSKRAAIVVLGATDSVQVTLRVESPLRYFDRPSQVRALAGEVVLSTSTIDADQSWSFDVPAAAIRAADGRIVIESSQTFVPADRGGPDRRELGLRVFDLRVETRGLR